MLAVRDPPRTRSVTFEAMRRTARIWHHVEVGEDLAVRRAGLEPKLQFVRRGMDGSCLSERGLPTPNIFTGGHDFHPYHEWICVPAMRAAVATIVHRGQV